MKHSIKIFSLFAFIMIFIFSACQKARVLNPGFDSPWSEASNALGIKLVTEGGAENGAVIASADEFRKYLGTGKTIQLQLQRVAEKNNLFTIKAPVGTVGPDLDDCWRQYQHYYDTHIEEWQQWANTNCEPLMICITIADCGLNVLIVVTPTSFKCNLFEATPMNFYTIKDFPFTPAQYDSQSVGDYLLKM